MEGPDYLAREEVIPDPPAPPLLPPPAQPSPPLRVTELGMVGQRPHPYHPEECRTPGEWGSPGGRWADESRGDRQQDATAEEGSINIKQPV